MPAEAEIVIEGEVSLEDTAEEGPYGDHTGYYNAVERFPVFTVTAITMRRDPIYLSTFTGRPPDEPSVLGEALNEVRSEEHTSELQSLMRHTYAVFCLKKKKTNK